MIVPLTCLVFLVLLESVLSLYRLSNKCILLYSNSFQSVSSLNESSLLPILSSLTSLSTLSLRRCDRVFDYSSLSFCTLLSSLTITDTMQVLLPSPPLILLLSLAL